jgi:SAM-dependent methyltransferase
MYLVFLKVFGHWLTLINGDTLVLDRMSWLKKNLPATNNGEQLLDVGCGSGAITLGARLLGYHVCGMSWDAENQKKAQSRAQVLGLSENSEFPIGDARKLKEFVGKRKFDVVINFENIEHILDDRQLMTDIYDCLRPGGYLYLTTPNRNYRPMSIGDMGPFEPIEDGRHVRRGYSPAMLSELCDSTGFILEEIQYCSFLGSQLVTRLLRFLSAKTHPMIGWVICLPIRPFAYYFDKFFKLSEGYSITLIAMKPRF